MPKKPEARKRGRSSSLEAVEIEDSLQKNWILNFNIRKQFHLNEKHKSFYDCIKNDSTNMVFVDGAAGTNKTYISVLAGLELLKEGKVKQIIYIRSVIESASRSIGALPGEIDDKFMPYAMPLIEKVREITDDSTAAALKTTGFIQAIPVNFVRGLTFHESFVIVDETQNLSKEEIITILTRFGRNSKYVICGDMKQSDIGDKSGFDKIYNKFNTQESQDHHIHTFKFGDSEIVRSKILRFIVDVLEAKH
jgi:phosphate starvation-inducible protein PhoH and related proteins